MVGMRALAGRIDQAGTVLPQGFEEGGCIPAVLGTGALIARIECTVSPIRPEVRPVPERHHPEHPRLNPEFARWTVPLQKMKFLESFEYPEREIDIDAERIRYFTFKLV